jgi:hypothetical protein
MQGLQAKLLLGGGAATHLLVAQVSTQASGHYRVPGPDSSPL